MKYLGDSFSVFPGDNKNYRDNYDRIFGKKSAKADPWAGERPVESAKPKKMSDLPPPREAQSAPKSKKPKGTKKPKNEKPKAKAKAKKKKQK